MEIQYFQPGPLKKPRLMGKHVIKGHACTNSKYIYRTKMCTVCIISRIKAHVTSMKDKHFYLRHILQATETLISGGKCPYMSLLLGQARDLLGQVTH